MHARFCADQFGIRGQLGKCLFSASNDPNRIRNARLRYLRVAFLQTTTSLKLILEASARDHTIDCQRVFTTKTNRSIYLLYVESMESPDLYTTMHLASTACFDLPRSQFVLASSTELPRKLTIHPLIQSSSSCLHNKIFKKKNLHFFRSQDATMLRVDPIEVELIFVC